MPGTQSVNGKKSKVKDGFDSTMIKIFWMTPENDLIRRKVSLVFEKSF